PQRSALNRLHAEFLVDPTRASLDDSTVGLEPLGAEIQARASCLGHPNPGLCGLHEEVDAFGGHSTGCQHLEMAVRELAVARDACVDDRAIELRADVQRTAPVLGRDAV